MITDGDCSAGNYNRLMIADKRTCFLVANSDANDGDDNDDNDDDYDVANDY